MTSFLWAYWLAGWRPGEGLVDSGPLYVQATGMTCLGVVAAQVGAGLAMRTDRRSILSVGPLTNRFLLVGIAGEVGLAIALVYVPALQRLFHTEAIGWEHWALLALWPPLVLAAEEARKALVRARAPTDRPAARAQAGSVPAPMPRSAPGGTLRT
jgi:magnesium-transporting ATPase (P-type)